MNFVQDLRCARNVVINAVPVNVTKIYNDPEIKLKARWHCLNFERNNTFAVVSPTGVIIGQLDCNIDMHQTTR